MSTRECPFCAETIQAKAIKCKHCGEDLRKGAPRASSKEKKKTSPLAMGCLIFFILVGVLWVMGSDGPSTHVGSGSTAPAENKPAAPQKPSTGSEGHIVNDTIAAVDKDASWDAVMEAVSAKDRQGLAQLIAAGRAFMLEPGVRILILDKSWTVVKIRALDGPNAGKAGWIVSEAYGP